MTLTLTHVHDDLLQEIASYLSRGDISSMAQTSKSLAAKFFPILYQTITINALQTIANPISLTFDLCSAHPATYVRDIDLHTDASRVQQRILQSAMSVIDRKVHSHTLRRLTISSATFTLADIFKLSPNRLHAQILILECPVIEVGGRKSLSIIASHSSR